MYIISENDNLLERLKLLVQASPLAGEVGSATEYNESTSFVACLMKERVVCGPGNKFIILVGKEWDKTTVETISDVSRLVMSTESSGRLLVVKKDVSENDSKELQVLIENVHEEWRSEWTYQFEKVRKLGDSKARSDMLKRIDNWTSPVPPKYSITDFDDPTLHSRIKSYFDIQEHMNIVDYSFLDKPKLIAKPPALHWTNYPRDAEIQFSFKFTFPAGTLYEDLFRTIVTQTGQCREWEYSYEWINGILFKEDSIKLTVVRSENHNLEISGRIDKDEVGDEDADAPFRPVWPYLAHLFKVVYNLLESHASLPQVLNIVFIGDIFFDTIKSHSEEASLNARSLDAVQTLGALERVKNVRFKVGDVVHALNLAQAFPDFEPHVLSDFWIQNLKEPKTKKFQPVQSPKVSTVDSPPIIPSCGMNSLNVHKNRGRRVSFGGIKDIPSNSPTLLRSGSNHIIEAESARFAPQLDIPEAPNNSSSEDETTQAAKPPTLNGDNKSTRSTSPNTLSDYVDNIVQKTIDEVLLSE